MKPVPNGPVSPFVVPFKNRGSLRKRINRIYMRAANSDENKEISGSNSEVRGTKLCRDAEYTRRYAKGELVNAKQQRN